jgi:hypothetical protein
MNNHIKTVEINRRDETLRIVERDYRGRIFGKSKFVEYECGTDAMRLAVTMHGYKHDHSTGLIDVYREVA